MNAKESLNQIKNSLIAEINQNFNSKQYKLINAVAEAALNILYEEALIAINSKHVQSDNSLSGLANDVEKR